MNEKNSMELDWETFKQQFANQLNKSKNQLNKSNIIWLIIRRPDNLLLYAWSPWTILLSFPELILCVTIKIIQKNEKKLNMLTINL